MKFSIKKYIWIISILYMQNVFNILINKITIVEIKKRF